ncbi:hypothetical protein HYV81_03815 [Candidatus Woesearchaeota archaeon]|nr:hypothetical protein [Candidatus Woesearchaeota archaeon]
MFKNKRNKRGAELSLNVIIVAAIALIVLVILVLIFTGRIAIFRFGVEDCVSKGGSCDTAAGSACPPDYADLPSASCYDANNKVDKNKKCCFPTAR